MMVAAHPYATEVVTRIEYERRVVTMIRPTLSRSRDAIFPRSGVRILHNVQVVVLPAAQAEQFATQSTPSFQRSPDTLVQIILPNQSK